MRSRDERAWSDKLANQFAELNGVQRERYCYGLAKVFVAWPNTCNDKYIFTVIAAGMEMNMRLYRAILPFPDPPGIKVSIIGRKISQLFPLAGRINYNFIIDDDCRRTASVITSIDDEISFMLHGRAMKFTKFHFAR